MNEIIEFIVEYWLQELLVIMSGFIGYIVKELKKWKARQSAVENGVQALLRNELIRCYREYKKAGELSILDKENIEHMFKEYENLGGNGTVAQLIGELLNMPTNVK